MELNEKEKAQRRCFSLEDDFMNYGTDDLLYGFLRCISTAKPSKNDEHQWEEYLPIITYRKMKSDIATTFKCTSRTIENHLNKLIKRGLVKKGTYSATDHTGKKYEYQCLYFPYDYNGIFKYVSKEMIKYLVMTRNENAIRIYLYLLNRYDYKPNYNFTVNEIQRAIGYSDTSHVGFEVVSAILTSFKREGLVDYDDLWLDVGNGNKIKKKILKFVEKSPPKSTAN